MIDLRRRHRGMVGHESATDAEQIFGWRSMVSVGAVVVGFALTLAGSIWIGLAAADLSIVWLTRDGVLEPVATTTHFSRAMRALVTAIGLFLLTLPRRWVVLGDLAQLFGAVWTLGWLALSSTLFSGAEFTDPSRQCVYDSCWPRGYQELAIATPLMVACLLMIAMASLGRQQPQWIRGLVPAGAFLLLMIVQAAIWDPIMIPFFNAPPPS